MMQKTFFILLTLMVLFSCGVKNNKKTNNTKDVSLHDANMENQEYNTSFSKWNKLKSKHNNSYTYTIVYNSFSGYSNTTKISVEDGEVIGREFFETDLKNPPNPEAVNQPKFIEDKSTLNTYTEGSPGVTIDQLYKDCSNKYLTADKNV